MVGKSASLSGSFIRARSLEQPRFVPTVADTWLPRTAPAQPDEPCRGPALELIQPISWACAVVGPLAERDHALTQAVLSTLPRLEPRALVAGRARLATARRARIRGGGSRLPAATARIAGAWARARGSCSCRTAVATAAGAIRSRAAGRNASARFRARAACAAQRLEVHFEISAARRR
jgi:hypothetical protein